MKYYRWFQRVILRCYSDGRHDRRHPWNRLERRLLLHFSENFAVVLNILTVECTHNIRSMSVKLICIYIHYKTCQTMRLFNPIWKIYSWTSHLFDRKELWFLPPKQNWPPRNNVPIDFKGVFYHVCAYTVLVSYRSLYMNHEPENIYFEHFLYIANCMQSMAFDCSNKTSVL
jgi:hypothetical protein